MMAGLPSWVGPCLPKRPCGGGLQDLGEQPLGERIFGEAPARQDHLQLACFEIASNPWCPAATVWGRRSRLFLGQWPLLVHELFLPSLSSHSVAIG